MKRSRIKRMSKKRRKVIDRIGPLRRTYLEDRWCVIELMKGRFLESTDVHETHGGSAARHITEKDPRYWLPVNRLNHDELQNMPKEKQWALKAYYFPEEFDVTALSDLPSTPKVDPALVLSEVVKLVKQVLT